MEKDIVLSPSDQAAIEKLQSFLPEKIFDMHMHIASRESAPTVMRTGSMWAQAGDPVDMDSYLRNQGRLFPHAKVVRANMIPMPDVTMKQANAPCREAATRFMVAELEKHPGCVGEAMVLAGDTRQDIEKQLQHPRIRGLKCYHQTALGENTAECTIPEYLPEAAWEVAQEWGLCITLHLVRRLSLSDPDNLQYIRTMAAKYPNARLILAHAARGFAAWTAVEAVGELAAYPNIYFDLSAVCEVPAICQILKTCGHKRVFWGSDYAISMMRGKCVSVGQDFVWLYGEALEKWLEDAYLVGVENLLAVRDACNLLDLPREAVEDIFYNNAMEFFCIEEGKS